MNAECARLILADADKYGDESLMAQWARMVLEQAQPTVRGPLFKVG